MKDLKPLKSTIFDNHMKGLLWPDLLFGKNTFTVYPDEGAKDYSELIKKHSQILHLGFHGAPLGTLPFGFHYPRFATRSGGGDRIPMSILHRSFFSIPIFGQFCRDVWNSSPDINTEIINKRLESGEVNDLFIWPEGDLTIFADEYTLAPFRSTKFIEIAIKNDLPMLLWGHVGTKPWQICLQPKKHKWLKPVADFFNPNLYALTMEHDKIYLPLNIYRLKGVHHMYRFHIPDVKSKDLPDDEAGQKKVFKAELKKLVVKWQEVIDELHCRYPDF